jgi:hypothetical protein
LSSDDWFLGKMGIEYGWRIRPELPHQCKSRKMEGKIMGVIAAHMLTAYLI